MTKSVLLACASFIVCVGLLVAGPAAGTASAQTTIPLFNFCIGCHDVLAWEDFNDWLPNNDRILVYIEENAVDPSLVEFVLATRLDWAKFIDLYTDQGQWGRIWTWAGWWRSGRPRDSIQLPAEYVTGGALELELGKAKLFGVWTGVYIVPKGELVRLQPGTRVTFHWVRD